MNLRSKRTKEVNLELTPLIDVVFLLLIFFMVSTTFDKQTQLKIDLPEAVTKNSSDIKEIKITVVINAKGEFAVNDDVLVRHDLKTLKAVLQKTANGNFEIPLIIKGDKQAPYQATITLLDAASQLGMSHLSFVAQQATEEN